MKRSWLVCLCALGACASTPGSTPVSAERLDVSDLQTVANALQRGSSQIYYKVFEFDPRTETYFHTRGGYFEGMLVARDVRNLTYLPNGMVTDGRFNTILLDLLESESGGRRIVSVTATPGNTTIVGVESDRESGRVSLSALFNDRKYFILLGQLEGLREFGCIDGAARRGSLLELLQCTGLRTGSSTANGGSFDSGFVEDLGGLLAEPDCSNDMLGPVTYPGEQYTPREWRRRAEAARGVVRERRRAVLSPTPLYRDTTEAFEDLAEAQEAVANAREEWDRVRDDPGATQAERDAASSEFKRALIAERRAMRLVVRLTNKENANANRNSPVDPAGLEAPTQFKDPRCAGRQTDSERGTLFTNADFCGDLDPLTCLLAEQDSVFRFSEGQCWTETGPDDARQIVCGEFERLPGRNNELTPDDLPDPGECPPDDIECWTDPVAPRTSRGGVATRYIDTTPLGALLAGICAKVGCPEPPP